MISPNDTVYISGPMTGMPDYNYPAFYAADSLLRARFGCQVINPARQEVRPSWEAYMRHDVNLLREATALFQLPGWERSRGARIEYELAVMAGIFIFSFPLAISKEICYPLGK